MWNALILFSAELWIQLKGLLQVISVSALVHKRQNEGAFERKHQFVIILPFEKMDARFDKVIRAHNHMQAELVPSSMRIEGVALCFK